MDEDRHFKGCWVRIFARMRAVGDAYDATVVLPVGIVLIVIHKTESQKLPEWAPLSAVLITGLVAGGWLGMALGSRYGLRAMLRGISVGALEAAGHAAFTETMDRSRAYVEAYGLIYFNLLSFWFAHLILSTISENILITEAQWQASAPRRSWVYAAFRAALGAKDGALSILAAGWIIRGIFLMWLTYEVHQHTDILSSLFSGSVVRTISTYTH